jgi:hypothetical protein
MEDRLGQRPVDFGQRSHQALDDGEDLREEGPLFAVVADAVEHEATKGRRRVRPNALHVRHDLTGAHEPQNLKFNLTVLELHKCFVERFEGK